LEVLEDDAEWLSRLSPSPAGRSSLLVINNAELTTTVTEPTLWTNAAPTGPMVPTIDKLLNV